MTVSRVLPAALNPDDELATIDHPGIAWRIRRLRRDRGWTQTEVGDACGVSRFAVSQWERRHMKVSLVMLCRLADAFGCRLDWIIRGRS
jgi:transcriptional regulator with XRE-family HTH domain